MKFRNDIQGLRSIAVIFVFLFHIDPSVMPGGFVGVDIFFVISGFLISSIVLKQKESGTFSFKKFYLNRVKRIVPAYYVLLLGVGLAAVFIYLGVDLTRFRLTLIHSAIFNSNAWFSSMDTYFGAASSENALLHTWTLAIEMKFYLFLPLILVWVRDKWLPAVISVLTVGLLAYGIIGIENGHKADIYFSLAARIPEFLIGVICNLALRHGTPGNHILGTVMNLTGFAMLIASAFLINEDSAFPGALALLPCVGTALVIVFPHRFTLPALTNRPMVFIGQISYSVYLWHWPVMAFTRYYYSISGFSPWQMVLIVATTAGLSVASYYLVETSFRKKGTTAVLAGITILLAVNFLVANNVAKLGARVENIPAEFAGPAMGRYSHAGSFSHAEVFGDTTRHDRIVLSGDSHANSLKPYLDYIGRRNGFSFHTATNDSYAPIPGIGEDKFKAKRFYNRYLGILPTSEKLLTDAEIIIITVAEASEAKNEDAIIDLIQNIGPNRVLLLLSDYPRLDKNPVRINRGIVRDPSRRNIYTVTPARPNEKLLAAIAASSNAYYVDLSGIGIFDDAPFYRDTLMYYDEDHLNIYGAVQYAKATEARFMRHLEWARQALHEASPE